MSAAPFALEPCVRTNHDGIVQHGWQVVRVFVDRRDVLHECFGVYSKQLAGNFLDGVLLMWFVAEKRRKHFQASGGRQSSDCDLLGVSGVSTHA